MVLFGAILAADKILVDNHSAYLLDFGTRPLVSHLAREMYKTKVKEWSVVLGYDHDIHRRSVENLPFRCVIDPEWQSGFASHVKIGLHEMPPKADGFIILPANLPFFNLEILHLLIDALEKDKGYIIVPAKDGEIFPFPLFHRNMLGEVLSHLDDGDFFSLIEENDAETYIIEVPDKKAFMRVSDKESYKKARDIFFKIGEEVADFNPQSEIPE